MRDPTAPELNHTHTHIFIHTSLGTASHSHTLCGLTPPMPHSFLWLRVNTMPVAPDATLLRTKARVALALGLAPVCRRNSSSRPVLCLKALSLFIFSAPSATASPALPPWPQTPPPPQPPSPAPHSPPSPPPDIQLSQTPIYQDVATTLNISGQGTAVGDTVVLLSAAGPPGCAGAQALTSTSQSSVITAQHTIEITLPHSLTYKMCISSVAPPTSDADFGYVTTGVVELTVTSAPSPPPNPPPPPPGPPPGLHISPDQVPRGVYTSFSCSGPACQQGITIVYAFEPSRDGPVLSLSPLAIIADRVTLFEQVPHW